MIKIAILGDSVSLRVRPVRLGPHEMTYGEHLSQNNPDWLVINLGKGATSIQYQTADMDTIIRQFPDYYILNFGIVDCSTRSVPQWVFRFINTIKPNECLIRRWVRKLTDFLEKKNRKTLVLLRGKKSWTSEKTFKSTYQKTINLLKKETGAHIVCLGINQTDDRVESHLPGTKHKISTYNQLIKSACENTGSTFIDTYNLIDLNRTPDGIHFDALGHEQIGRIIGEAIKAHNKC